MSGPWHLVPIGTEDKQREKRNHNNDRMPFLNTSRFLIITRKA